MKRHSSFATVLVLLSALALVACGPQPAATPTPDNGAPTPTPQNGDAEPPDGDPIVVGSTLALTGPLGATGLIHQIAGDQFVERLNAQGGLLGRQVEWIVYDDESDQANVATLYERLITQDGVDLIIGPYATPFILSAMAVAERHGFVMPQHTAVLAPLMTYECQFPAWSIGPAPQEFVPEQLYEALATLDEAPSTIVFVTNQSGSTDFITHGQPDVEDRNAVSIADEQGLEVLADISYPPGHDDWSAIAAQIRDLDPDFIMMNSLGVESVGLADAMEQLNYRPPMMFSLFPAPGPLLGLGEAGEGHLSVSTFEPNEPILERMGAEVREIVEEFQAEAGDAGLPYTAFETQATSSWTAWEILVAGVEGAGSLDQQAICDHLHANGAETTFHGHLEFDPEVNNFWPSTQGIKQIQDGDWVMVWPPESAAADLRGPQQPISPPHTGRETGMVGVRHRFRRTPVDKPLRSGNLRAGNAERATDSRALRQPASRVAAPDRL
jgi:branched-chain amino acid transport system substrate-binding protein